MFGYPGPVTAAAPKRQDAMGTFPVPHASRKAYLVLLKKKGRAAASRNTKEMGTPLKRKTLIVINDDG